MVLLVASAVTGIGPSIVASAPTAAALPPPSDVTEVNPDTVTPASSLKYGGRIEGIAINPVNTQVVLAASELGGLWRSTNGGNNWSHVDSLSLTRMYDVRYAAADSNLVIATGDNDGASPSRGGIWVSQDGGQNWTRPATANDDVNCGGPAGAHWLDIAGTTPGQLTVFVATDCGISVSTDSGTTWTHHFAAGPANARYWDVKTATVGGVIQASSCGDGGLTRSTDGAGATWSAYVGDNSELFGPNALGAPQCHIALAPGDPNTAFISAFKRETTAQQTAATECSSILIMSTNANVAAPTWTDLNACPNGDRNGRWPYVDTHPDPANPTTQFLVYFGDNSRTTIQTCTYTPTTCAAGPWPYYDGNNPHNGTDPNEVVFDPTTPAGCPAFLAGDGGISVPSDCSTNPGSWTYPDTGLNALDALENAGTVFSAHTSVYFGTQDNGFFDSENQGTNWNRRAYDIYSLNADHDATTNSPPSQVLWRNGAFSPPPTNHVNLSNENISSTSGLSLPPGNNPSDNYSATQFGYNSYAFITPDIAPAKPPAPQPNWIMYVTTNGGGAWTQMGPTAPGPPVGFPQASGPATHPTFYVILSVAGANKLYRLAGPMNSTAVWTDVTSNLTNPTTFGVHPNNPGLLYANDAGLNQVMRSTNGGSSWTADAGLTSIAQRGGQFPFANGGSQIAAFGFDGNSNTITAGANNSGVFASTDGGAHWFSVRGAENLPRITGFFFDQRTNSIYFASGGRGMWQLTLPAADLSITKTASPEPVTAGQQLTYTIKVTNSSSSAATATDVTVTDVLPSDVTYLTNSNSCTEAPAGTLTCPIPDLAPGASYTFTITTLVHSNTVAGTGGAKTITNTATVSSADTSDPNQANNIASATSTVVDSADLSIAKLCKPDTTVYAGTPITCSVFVDNHGPSDARNVVIDDVIKSNGTFTVGSVSVTPGTSTCPVTSVTGGQQITCSVGNLAAASTTQTGRVTLTYTVTATEGQDIDNLASVRSDTPDPNSANNAVQVNLTVTSVADLALTKSGPATVVAGAPITWTLSVHNNGPSTAHNVLITDNVPAGVTITSVTMPGASCNAGAAGNPALPTTCTFDPLGPGATSNLMTITATVNPGTTGTLENDARVSSATFDSNSSNNLATAVTSVQVQADVSIVKTATPNPVTPGTALSYKLTVSNAGPSTATSIVVTDALPASLIFGSTGGVGTCGFQTNTNTVTCSVPNLDPGTSESVFIYTTVKSSVVSGSITNTATVVAAGTDPNTGNNSSTISTTVNTSADLAITLASDLNVYKPSTVIHYQFSVTNAGPSDAQSVVVVIALPPKKSGYYISNNAGCPPPSGTTFTCPVGTIPSGAGVSFQLNFFIQGNKGTITSTATVSSPTFDPNTSNNTSVRNVTVK
ncbi:MAG: hypothetical protein QOG80_2428 [Pseudonocardiales bacterium]|nr:hypothetical protein [Pseudonocardiales bacterium]